MITWIYLRHYLNIVILISGFYEFKTIGPYILDWENEQFKCLASHIISTILLAGMQLLDLVWRGWVLRTAWRYAVMDIKEDERSDDDDKEWRAEVREEEGRTERERELIALEKERREKVGGVNSELRTGKNGKNTSRYG
jgi:acyl-CoA-dependent ceramide synthase